MAEKKNFPSAPSATDGFMNALTNASPPVTILAEIGKSMQNMRTRSEASLENSGEMGDVQSFLSSVPKSQKEQADTISRDLYSNLPHGIGKKEVLQLMANAGELEGPEHVDALTIAAAQRVVKENGFNDPNSNLWVATNLARYATALSDSSKSFAATKNLTDNLAVLSAPVLLMLDGQKKSDESQPSARPPVLTGPN